MFRFVSIAAQWTFSTILHLRLLNGSPYHEGYLVEHLLD
jgi:hypothetical protein